jgi:hypothetical protein
MGVRLSSAFLTTIIFAGCSTVSTREPPVTPLTEAKLSPEAIQAVIPTGTAIADARALLEKFGFRDADQPRQVNYGPSAIEIVTFERTDKHGWVSNTWHVAVRLRDGKVIDVHATHYLTGT